MKMHQYHFLKPGLITMVSVCIILVISVATLSFKYDDKKVDPASITIKDSIASQKAFLQVYKVLMSPRCMNCHPAGDVPLQGDDNHLHPQGVKRGPEGKGLYALKCSNCHQTENTPGLNMPPGADGWHLPPANMRLVFQGRSPHDLAMQLKNRSQNGNKSLHDLIEHMNTDLVKWGWEPGDGRSTPPLGYAEFVNQVKIWIDNGAVVPPKGVN
jgi:mono/diheme cytochrome c family protein